MDVGRDSSVIGKASPKRIAGERGEVDQEGSEAVEKLTVFGLAAVRLGAGGVRDFCGGDGGGSDGRRSFSIVIREN